MNKLVLALLLVLPACISQEQRDQQLSARSEAREQLLASLEDECLTDDPGTKSYLRCVEIGAEKRGYIVVAQNYVPVALKASEHIGASAAGFSHTDTPYGSNKR